MKVKLPIVCVSAILSVLLLVTCSKDDAPVGPPPPSTRAPVVTGVNKTIVAWGDTLVVSGSGFVSPANANAVTFTEPSSATAAFERTDTTLSVVVPRSAATGEITVSNSGGTATGPWVEVKPPAPVVTGVSATLVSPGDIITVHGSRFLSPPDANTVTFANPLSATTPFAGTDTTLSVVVQENATTGAINVLHEGGSADGPVVEVQRNIGDYFVFGGLGADQKLVLPIASGSPLYLVIPHATNANTPYNQALGYDIETESVVPVASAVAAGPHAANTAGEPETGLQEAFEAWRWEQARELVERRGTPRRPVESLTSSTPAAPQAMRQFYVLKTITGSVINPSSYQQVAAELRYAGTKCLIYTDLDTLATGNLAMSDLRAIGESFDNGIEATNVQYFGNYSDIDGNGRAIILVTPVVNRLTPGGYGGFIAGFFLSVDLYSPPAVPSGVSNQAEIFYLLAADPSAQWGNTFPVDFTRDTNISTAAHEHEHMISFSHRLFNEGGSVQSTWLEEGMAHMAEDLNGFHVDNQKRAAIYLANPGVTSLEDNTAPLSQRGGVYLFLRLMADRYGTGILKQIVQSSCNSRICIQDATGEDFYSLVAEFLAALYLSGSGITGDPRFNYTSIDLADYGTLGIANRVVGGGLVAGDIRRSAGDFYLFSDVAGNQSRFTFNDQVGNARLRNVVVRVQ